MQDNPFDEGSPEDSIDYDDMLLEKMFTWWILSQI
jgi:hypothetical protein